MELANDRTNEENTHLFKKVGSNFQIKDRTVLFEPRGAWKTLLDFRFGGNSIHSSALRADPIFGGILNSEFLRCVGVSNLRVQSPQGYFSRFYYGSLMPPHRVQLFPQNATNATVLRGFQMV
jgi:hypothetical protein